MLKKLFRLSAVAAAVLLVAGAAHAAGVIINPAGTVALGINDEGHLNTEVGNIAANAGATGLSFKFADGSWRDATSPGCLCEGWGVSVNGATSGYANVSVDGVVNLTVDSFVIGATSATSMVHLTSLPGLSVTQAYAPATNAPGALFENVVTITNNTGATVDNVQYVRVMDWDVPPTEFEEFVTIQGTGLTPLLNRSHDDGFATANPLTATSGIDAATEDVDFVDNGPADHGAYFRFDFGSLADGESYTFSVFYGAAANETLMLAALAAEGVQLYSLGQSTDALTGGVNNDGATYAFGFRGVGEPPAGAPEPASLALLGIGLAGMALTRRRRRS